MPGPERAHIAGPARLLAVSGAAPTRARILHEATILFAERGFHAATVRDLAQRAGVNVAAINYHFRSKEELHRAVLEQALAEWSSEAIAAADLPRDLGLGATLRAVIAALVAPAIERQGNRHLLRLIAWNLLEPPDRCSGQPMQAFALTVVQVISPFLPEKLPPGEALLLAQWLVGQCLLVAPPLRDDAEAPQAHAADLIDRLTALALGGFGALRSGR